MVYLSSALLALRHWTTDMAQATFVCVFYGGLLFLPVCSGVVLLQIVVRRITNRMPKASWTVRCMALLTPPLLLMLFAINHAKMGQRDRELSFLNLFPATPATLRVLDYGYERTALGGGTYVFVFEVPEGEFGPFIKAEGYQAVGIESDPEQWRLDLCNSAIGRLTRSPFRVVPNCERYERRTAATAARIFYSRKDQTAVFVGFGRY
jgi:hypothetical protein